MPAIDNGWVKLHRSLQTHWLWSDLPFSKGQAWVDLILLANHKDIKVPYQGKVITCKRGDVNRSLLFLSKRWGWSRDKTRAFIHALESDAMLTIKATTHQTTITIENYDIYQDYPTTNQSTDRQQTSQPTDSKPTTNKNDKKVLLSQLPDGSEKKPRFDTDSCPYKAATWLRDQIIERLPGATPVTERQLQKWADAFDKCNRIDGHTWEDIEGVLSFSQQDQFWSGIILDGLKFRKKYTELLAAQARKERRGENG
jgi:hypothetical protein